MANQISKEAILSFLNERLDSRKSNTYDSANRYFYNNQGSMDTIEAIIGNIERGMFDENIPDGLKQLHEWGEQSM
jgi:hypothetical protein